MENWLTRLKGLRRYPSLAAGLLIVILFIGLSLYTVIALPYSEAIRLWRGGPGVWDEYPKNAAPVWFDLFTTGRLPRTIIVTSEDTGTTRVEPLDDDIRLVEIVLPFKYNYDGFPKELNLFTTATFEASHMPVSQISAISAINSSRLASRNGGRLLPPDSSSPSSRMVILQGRRPWAAR